MKKLSDMDDNEMLHNITSKIIIMIRRTQHAAATEELTKALYHIRRAHSFVDDTTYSFYGDDK